MLRILVLAGIGTLPGAAADRPALVVIDTGVSASLSSGKDAPLAGAFISETLNDLQARDRSTGLLLEVVDGSKGPMTDRDGHGTHLCGILWDELVALEGDPEPALVMLKAGDRKMAAANLLRALRRVGELDDGKLRVRVLLCAFNLYPDDCEPGEFEAFGKALRALMDDGVWVVASAGNHGRNLDEVQAKHRSLPACLDHPNRIVVAAANDRGLLTARSNYGPGSVWIAAPGVRVESLGPEGGKRKLSGSSQAAAVVAARLFHEAKEHPDTKLPEIRKRIEAEAVRHPSLLQTIRSGRFLPRAEAKD